MSQVEELRAENDRLRGLVMERERERNHLANWVERVADEFFGYDGSDPDNRAEILANLDRWRGQNIATASDLEAMQERERHPVRRVAGYGVGPTDPPDPKG